MSKSCATEKQKACEFATVYAKEKKLTPAERTAKLLAPKPRSYFNSVINPRSEPGTSAMARAQASI